LIVQDRQYRICAAQINSGPKYSGKGKKRFKNRMLIGRHVENESKGERLTAKDHHADGEDLLILGERGHVTEPDARHTGQREVQRCGVRHAS